MKRVRTVPVGKKIKKSADAILTADIHLTNKTPVSRTDDYIQAQERKLKFLAGLSQENDNCLILCAGDVFDYWKASPWLCSWAHRHLPRNLVTIPGNHDLPMHSSAEYEKSALALLEIVGREISVLKGDQSLYFPISGVEVFGIPFGMLKGYDPPAREGKHRRILLLHELIWPGTKPPWAKGSYSAAEILDRFDEDFDLIVTGDNHQSFVEKGEISTLVNPGSMMRRTADQMDFQPKCYLYYAGDNSVVPVDFPVEQDVHNIEHLTGKKERDERIAAYVERMSFSERENTRFLSFQDNLQTFFQENKTPRKVREIIWQYLETI